jgi:hypothetical protein
MGKSFGCLLGVCLVAGTVFGQLAGYETLLRLDEPIAAGTDLVITGDGAPSGDGIWVELWRIPNGSNVAQSVQSVATDGAGLYSFEGVTASEGDQLYVTLSRSWQFETDGDFEGWNLGVSPDVTLEVTDGTLLATLGDGNADGWWDAYFTNAFMYNSTYYRVIEVRLRNSGPPVDASPAVQFGIFWGAPWPATIDLHNAMVPTEMGDFQTFLIPMGKDEFDVVPGNYAPADDLWVPATGMNNLLRVDPYNNVPFTNPVADGVVFEIDYIRIREDLRWEYNNGDVEGMNGTNCIANMKVENGFLTYEVVPDDNQAVDPYFFSTYDTGHLATEYFTRACIGFDNPAVSLAQGPLSGFFVDADSLGYWDDGGPEGQTTLQQFLVTVPYQGRLDAVAPIDDYTVAPKEWAEDNKVHVGSLRLDFPDAATDGDKIAIDYYGIIPDEPFGPSVPVVVKPGGPVGTKFKRGDANDDGQTNIADAVFTLSYLFANGPDPNCMDAADTNDSGGINIADAVALLSYLFASAGDLPEPFTTCGVDPSPETPLELPCERFNHCTQ